MCAMKLSRNSQSKPMNKHAGMFMGLEMRRADGTTTVVRQPGELLIPEALISELSKQYFDDPHPCFIHRGAVLSRLFMQVSDAVSACEWTAIELMPHEERNALRACDITHARLMSKEGLV
ncbi:hypothetical protein FACS1894184_02520 [Clostridia bacterium]|nr:hypothetical protein FACS1894184_02520 [Clostridia bacterium]